MIMALADRHGEIVPVTITGEESPGSPGLFIMRLVEGKQEAQSRYRVVLNVARRYLANPTALKMLAENDVWLTEKGNIEGHIRFLWK